jgi:hypothetical protein
MTNEVVGYTGLAKRDGEWQLGDVTSESREAVLEDFRALIKRSGTTEQEFNELGDVYIAEVYREDAPISWAEVGNG